MSMTTQSRPYQLRVYGWRVRTFKTLGAALKAFRALGAIRDGAWAILINGEVLAYRKYDRSRII